MSEFDNQPSDDFDEVSKSEMKRQSTAKQDLSASEIKVLEPMAHSSANANFLAK